MTKPDFSDEMLMRFADGELDAETSTAIEQAMETDDDLVARVALFLETRAEAKAALKPLLDEPVPEHLVAAVERMVKEKKAKAMEAEPATVVPFRPVAPRELMVRRWTLPLAACIAAAVGGIGGYLVALPGPGQNELHVAGIDSPALGRALATIASGQQTELADSGQRFRAIATFRDSADALCREFEVDSPNRSTVISVACRSGETWQVSFAVVAPGTDSGYAPASSTEALDAYLAAIDAQPPMEAGEETEALRTIAR